MENREKGIMVSVTVVDGGNRETHSSNPTQYTNHMSTSPIRNELANMGVANEPYHITTNNPEITETKLSPKDLWENLRKQRQVAVSNLKNNERSGSGGSSCLQVPDNPPHLVPGSSEPTDTENGAVDSETKKVQQRLMKRPKSNARKHRKPSIATVVNLARHKNRPVKRSVAMAATVAVARARFREPSTTTDTIYTKQAAVGRQRDRTTQKDWMKAAAKGLVKTRKEQSGEGPMPQYRDPDFDEDDSYPLLVKPRWVKAWKAALHKLELALPGTSGSKDGEDEEKGVLTSAEKLQKTLESIKISMEEEGAGVTLETSVNGMRQFGISKGHIARAVVAFTEPPRACPLTVCFHFPHTFLNHSYVRHMVLTRIRPLPGAKIESVQFVERNVFHGTRAQDNRWVIRVNTAAACNALLSSGIEICNRRIQMRSLDAVLRDEYNEYKEYLQLQKKYMYEKFRTITGSENIEALSVIRDVTEQVLPDPERRPSALPLGPLKEDVL